MKKKDAIKLKRGTVVTIAQFDNEGYWTGSESAVLIEKFEYAYPFAKCLFPNGVVKSINYQDVHDVTSSDVFKLF